MLAEVAKINARQFQPRGQQKRKSMLTAVVTDGRRALSLTWFNQAWREKQLKPGTRALFAGKVGRYKNTWQLVHPEYLLLPVPSMTARASRRSSPAR